MKKLILLTLFVLIACITADAQSSMSDSQIISFIQKEQKAGTSQQQIVVKLMEKGVTVDRLQEVRRKYEKLGGQNAQGAKNLSGKAGEERGRTGNNGQNASPLQKMSPSYQGAIDEQNEGYMAMRSELGTFMPDSTEMFDQEMVRLILEQNRRKIFGHDIFNNRNLTFEPSMAIATPLDYVLGPGDQVFVDVYGATQKTLESTVSPDGFITIEGYGIIDVSGLTVKQANARLRSQLGARYSSSNIKLTVGSTKSIMVNVMGEVVAPGTYTLSAFASVFHALYMAGGVNDIGTLRDIKVYRKNKLVTSVDIYDYILNGKLTGNVRLSDNDVIVVGTYDCLVNVTGKVKRPMFYEMKSGESLASVIKYAGGFAGDAYRNTVRVVRKAGKEYSVWNVAEFDMGSFQVCDEDSISIDSVIPRYSNMVELRGAVMRPGMYQWGGEMTTVRSLLQMADGLRPEAMSHHAVITRTREDRSLEAIAVNLKAILDGSEADFPLCNEDVLFVPTFEEATKSKSVSIYGEVYYPGEYQYASGMTVEDFILQAGGLTESASREKVTVSRRDNSTYTVELKENFALTGEKGFTLDAFDEVYVGKAVGYEKQAVIEVDGEVVFRGHFALPVKNARLTDVMSLAGGATKDGSLKGARVIRKMDDEERRNRERQLANLRVYNAELVNTLYQNVGPDRRELVDSLLESNFVDVENYIVGIDLEKAMKNPGSKYDIQLRDGDKLFIPTFDSTVKITGEVNSPTITTFDGSRRVRHYIHAAGGYSNAAWKNHAYIIHQNGQMESLRHGAKVDAGSEIVVPTRSVRPVNNTLPQVFSTIASAVASITAVLITAVRR